MITGAKSGGSTADRGRRQAMALDDQPKHHAATQSERKVIIAL
jgi:hypothetical protein